jgi:hypothetical protein
MTTGRVFAPGYGGPQDRGPCVPDGPLPRTTLIAMMHRLGITADGIQAREGQNLSRGTTARSVDSPKWYGGYDFVYARAANVG